MIWSENCMNRILTHHLLSSFSFSSLRFVRLDDLFSTNLPLLPSEFEEFVQRQCQTTRDELVEKWVLPVCQTVSKTGSLSLRLQARSPDLIIVACLHIGLDLQYVQGRGMKSYCTIGAGSCFHLVHFVRHMSHCLSGVCLHFLTLGSHCIFCCVPVLFHVRPCLHKWNMSCCNL